MMQVYACGCNGFQQISQCIDTLSNTTAPHYSLPVKLMGKTRSASIQQCLITWSKLLFKQNEDDWEAVAATWNQILYRNANGGYSLTSDSEMIDTRTDINIDTELSCVVGGEKHFYCLHDKGHLSQMVFSDTLISTSETRENADSQKVRSTLVLRPVFMSLPVTDVSCGKEHVLFLTATRQVFSFGLGSRGQLGHDSVDEETSPRLVDVLDGLTVVAVSAGGWHSAAITGSGDLFTWGWNESGQLGHASRKPLVTLERKTLKSDSTQDTSSLTADIDSDEITPPLVEPISKESHPTSSVSDVSKDSFYNLNQQTITVSETDNACGVTLLSSPLLVTSLPADYTAVKVSCGSRHTAVVTADGELYTAGWNKYGQLGQDHTRSTDSFAHVHLAKVKVKDVLSGFWNTVIFSEEIL